MAWAPPQPFRRFDDSLVSWKVCWRKRREVRVKAARQMYSDECAEIGKPIPIILSHYMYLSPSLITPHSLSSPLSLHHLTPCLTASICHRASLHLHILLSYCIFLFSSLMGSLHTSVLLFHCIYLSSAFIAPVTAFSHRVYL